MTTGITSQECERESQWGKYFNLWLKWPLCCCFNTTRWSVFEISFCKRTMGSHRVEVTIISYTGWSRNFFILFFYKKHVTKEKTKMLLYKVWSKWYCLNIESYLIGGRPGPPLKLPLNRPTLLPRPLCPPGHPLPPAPPRPRNPAPRIPGGAPGFGGPPSGPPEVVTAAVASAVHKPFQNLFQFTNNTKKRLNSQSNEHTQPTY